MKETRDNLVLALLEQVASEGRRCPTNPDIAAYLRERGFRAATGSIPSILKRLTGQGHIIIRVYGYNWRDVIICIGPHAGKKTLPPTHGGKPHIVIDAAEREKRDAQRPWP